MKSLKTVMREASTAIAEKTQALKNATQEEANKALQQATDSVHAATSSITNAASEKINAIKSATQEEANKALQQATNSVQAATSSITNAATEKINAIKNATQEEAMKLFDSWLNILPTFSDYGLKTNALAMGYSISPSLEIELKGESKKFDESYLKKLLENENNNAIKSVLQAIKTTVTLYNKVNLPIQKYVLVAIKIQISPEIKVYIGIPEGQ